MRKCSTCQARKRTSAFNGTSKTCKRCKIYRSKHYQANCEDILKKRKEYYSKNKNIVLKRKFGITLEDYNRILVKQENKCAICEKVGNDCKYLNNNITSLHIDHCHKTKKVRRLLCKRCNMMPGIAKEDIQVLNKAIEYLIQHNLNK